MPVSVSDCGAMTLAEARLWKAVTGSAGRPSTHGEFVCPSCGLVRMSFSRPGLPALA